MKISLAYALRAISAVLAILLGAAALQQEFFFLRVRMEDQPQYSLLEQLPSLLQPIPFIFATQFFCGVLVLILRWNLLIPLWLIFPGIILLDVLEPWNVLYSISDLARGRWASTDLILPAVWLGIGLLPAAIAYKIDPPRTSSVSRFQTLGMILVAVPVAVMLLQESALFIGDLGKERPETFYDMPAGYSIAMAALRIVFVAILGLAVFAFSRRRTVPLLVVLGLVLGKTFEPFGNVFYALLYGDDFSYGVPHRTGDYFHYVPHAIAFAGCLVGLALIAFVTRKRAPVPG